MNYDPTQKNVNDKYELDQHHINYICSESTLKAWVTKSIKERCVLFHRQFPEKFIKPWRLRMIYRVNLIKRKTIKITKMPRRIDNSRYEGLRAVMRERLSAAIQQKRKIIWLDETMFTRTTNLSQEWSKRNKNIWLPVERMNIRYTAVIAAVSEGCGFEYFEQHDCAVDSEIFCGFIR